LQTVSPSARWLVIAVAALGGLVIGSFLNVVVYRAPRGLSVVRPGSFCPHCSVPVRTFDNVPVVSWLVLGGRCRACHAPISARYPLVEAGTGLLFGLLAAAVGPHPAVAGLCVAAAGAATSLAIELDGEPLPPAVPAVAAGLGLAALAAASGVEGHWARLTGAVIGTISGTGASVVVARTGTAGRARPAEAPAARGAWPATAWAFVPAGTLIGWSEPIGAAVGASLVAVGIFAFAASSIVGAPQDPRSGGEAPGRDRSSANLRAGPAVVAMAAAAGALVAALAGGTGLS
jgi:leader peptidase (prepilin peptidase)/N-methyltransferase